MNSKPSSKTVEPIERLAESAAHTGDKLASAAQSGIEATRTLTNQALDKANAKVGSLRDDVQPAIDAVSARVQHLASRGMAAAAETRDQARDTFSAAADRTSAYVAEKPLKAMAIAAAGGALLAILLGRRRR